MESQLFTLSKIFTERLFRIPDYQRGYAWTERQLKDFWNDINQIEAGRNHYTGVLTLEEVPQEVRKSWVDDNWIVEARGYEPLYVVDGQQRLTTSIVLIQCILEVIPADTPLNYTSKEQIQQKFIFDTKDEGISRSYIFGYEKDNPSYEFLKTSIFREFSSTNVSEETIYTNNLANAKSFFSQKLSEMSFEEVEGLYRKVTQNLLFNIFTISDEVDVCVAFETMNNRGKPLSDLELLKNRLIYLSLKLDVAETEKEKLRRAINDCWKAIYHNLGRNKDRPLQDDEFLNSHYLLHFVNPIEESEGDERKSRMMHQRMLRQINSRSPYGDLLETKFVTKRISGNGDEPPEIGLADIYKYVSSLQAAVTSWYRIFNPKDCKTEKEVDFWLDKLDRLDKGGAPLVLSVLTNIDDDEAKIDILRKLERHLFIITLGDRYYYRREYGDISFLNEAILLQQGKITAKKVAKEIQDRTNDILSRAGFMDEVRKEFQSRGFYSWSEVRYFLYEHNLDLQLRSKTERTKLNWLMLNERAYDHKSVEHIYPQRAQATYWRDRFSDLTQKQRNSLKNAIGNLLPISLPKNASLSNRPFPEKVSGKKEEAVGYRFGCYSENEVAKEKEWTQEAILRRSLKMLQFMEKRWGFSFGSEQQKITMLGLGFVHKRISGE
ncbi:DUF262 domain-containing protein [Shimia sp. R9_3]|uniref:DUF262 domain-containing protein n=1 Tax=Shimia sp. R9_3 TaxID=2821113 RepID=UPI001ADC2EE3|nr:DUF262 domain-containing protein [Shimia sp. R9_3]MBO9399551.1 DUF262 domain-containing protein [Shimia sp. R9_3]